MKTPKTLITAIFVVFFAGVGFGQSRALLPLSHLEPARLSTKNKDQLLKIAEIYRSAAPSAPSSGHLHPDLLKSLDEGELKEELELFRLALEEERAAAGTLPAGAMFITPPDRAVYLATLKAEKEAEKARKKRIEEKKEMERIKSDSFYQGEAGWRIRAYGRESVYVTPAVSGTGPSTSRAESMAYRLLVERNESFNRTLDKELVGGHTGPYYVPPPSFVPVAPVVPVVPVTPYKPYYCYVCRSFHCLCYPH